MGSGDCETSPRSDVLRHIRRYYRKALKQLPVGEFPSLLTAGACFGLLDPVSNIIVNTTIAGTRPSRKTKRVQQALEEARDKEQVVKSSTENKRGKKRKRSQQTIEVEEAEVNRKEIMSLAARGIAKRSLHGLLAFLVCHFRYLHTRDALHYLRVAKADLVVAVRLIDMDRRVKHSSTTDPITTNFQVALKCAAVSARVPCPDKFADTWISLATASPRDLQNELLKLSSNQRLQDVLLTLPLPPVALVFHLHKPLDKISRQRYTKELRDGEAPASLTASLLRRLHDMIHRIYLKAIARLPRNALRTRHHRGLLKAGYCFGPMEDPVSNILLNTIWYDTAFPVPADFEADMLCAKSLVRVQVRSGAGLVRFLCTVFPDLARHDAVVLLLKADASLQLAMSFARLKGYKESGSYEKAYRGAAQVAWHPDPAALADFALSPVLPATLLALRTGAHTLSNKDVKAISASFATALSSRPSHNCKPVQQVRELRPLASSEMIRRCQERFKDDQFFFRGLAEAALEEYSKQSSGPEYQLHVICGVNEEVPENGKNGYYDLRDGHPYCHMNFWAKPKGPLSAGGTAPKLFFVECTNDDEDTEVVRCYPVDPLTDDGRCFHCEQRTKIVHPSFGRYRGCDMDFEEMARRKGTTFTNDDLIYFGSARTEFLVGLPNDDLVYFDPRWDLQVAERCTKADVHRDVNRVYPLDAFVR